VFFDNSQPIISSICQGGPLLLEKQETPANPYVQVRFGHLEFVVSPHHAPRNPVTQPLLISDFHHVTISRPLTGQLKPFNLFHSRFLIAELWTRLETKTMTANNDIKLEIVRETGSMYDKQSLWLNRYVRDPATKVIPIGN
jgi:hypothetical protein